MGIWWCMTQNECIHSCVNDSDFVCICAFIGERERERELESVCVLVLASEQNKRD